MNADQASAILNFLVPTLEREHTTTLRVLSAVPADKTSYTPDPKSMSAFELMWHIASSEAFFMSGASAGAFEKPAERPAEVSTPSDVVNWYKVQFASSLDQVRRMSGEDLIRIVNFFEVFTQPAISFLQLAINHTVHHRGQLSVYLRPMGAKVPGIYGPSADEGMGGAGEATA
jgi:uncharacterized damage-inducible protein DinB